MSTDLALAMIIALRSLSAVCFQTEQNSNLPLFYAKISKREYEGVCVFVCPLLRDDVIIIVSLLSFAMVVLSS